MCPGYAPVLHLGHLDPGYNMGRIHGLLPGTAPVPSLWRLRMRPKKNVEPLM
jgi:hypothetical protein